jgi:hypothetical protein
MTEHQHTEAAEGRTYSEREWEEFSVQQQAAWDAEDRQEQAAREAEDARFAALPPAEQQAEAEERGWSLAIQREPEPEAEAG